jgi:hypothetical protein
MDFRNAEEQVADALGRRAELGTQKIKQLYDNLASKIPVGIYILRSTPEGTFSLDYASSKMAEMLNISVESLLADCTAVFQAIHPDDVDGFVKLNRDGIQQRRPFDWTGRILIKGRVKWLHFGGFKLDQIFDDSCSTQEPLVWYLRPIVWNQANFTFSRGWPIIGIFHFGNGLIDLPMCTLPHIACGEEDVSLPLVLVARYQ